MTPAEAEPADDRFVTVAWVYDRCELALLLSLFEDRGIWVVQVGAQHVAVDWAITMALGGVALRVRAADALAACELLAGLDRPAPRRAVFVDNRLLDVALMVAMLIAFWIPPPAKLPAHFAFDRDAVLRRTQEGETG
jgi:hypothetical protein